MNSLKNLTYKLLVFGFPVFIIGTVMELSIRHIPNDYNFKNELLEKNSETIETLILGGSHSFYGINPEILDQKAFNLAYVSQSVFFDNLLLQKYIENLPQLRNVIMMVAYPTLSHKYNEGEEAWRKFNYFRYYDIEPPDNRFYQKYYLELFNIPFNKNIKKIYRNIKGESGITSTEMGWYNKFKKGRIIDLDSAGLAATIRHENNSMDFTFSMISLNNIIDVCVQKGIQLHLITFPSLEGYRTHLNKQKFDKMVNTCTDISKKYNHVNYYNFSSDLRFNREDFYDGDHLNEHGAQKFTEILNRLLN